MNAAYIAIGAAFVAIGGASLANSKKAVDEAKARNLKLSGLLMLAAGGMFMFTGVIAEA